MYKYEYYYYSWIIDLQRPASRVVFLGGDTVHRTITKYR